MAPNLPDARERIIVEIRLDLPQKRVPREHLVVQCGCGGIERVQELVPRVVEAVRNLVDIPQLDSTLFEAIGDRSGRKPASVLLAAEALLRGGGDSSVHHERGGGVMPLGNPVFPFLQLWPMTLFARN